MGVHERTGSKTEAGASGADKAPHAGSFCPGARVPTKNALGWSKEGMRLLGGTEDEEAKDQPRGEGEHQTENDQDAQHRRHEGGQHDTNGLAER